MVTNCFICKQDISGATRVEAMGGGGVPVHARLEECLAALQCALSNAEKSDPLLNKVLEVMRAHALAAPMRECIVNICELCLAIDAHDEGQKDPPAVPDAETRDARIRRATEEVLKHTDLDDSSPDVRLRLLELRAAVGLMTVDPHDVGHGLYEITWKEEEGTSLAAVGSDRKGNRWFAPTNWISGPSYDWNKVGAIKLIKGPPKLADLVDSVECERGDFPAPKE